MKRLESLKKSQMRISNRSLRQNLRRFSRTSFCFSWIIINKFLENIMAEALTDYLERNPLDARAIIEKCIISSKARKAAKAARQTVLRKGILEGLALPGKLADCASKDPEESELYIVEGESAGGST
ncbi:MAG: DNA gyrase subunit B, partial [Candidatus Dadabacteria bacterium]|nr:DNA gyrase subunit B [Candidatus Dadabacteria bacterium]